MTTNAARAARRGPDTVEILHLRIELEEIRPTVWRSLLVRASSPLSTLHTAAQEAMGWHDSHLHEFAKDGVRYGPDWRLEDDPDLASERKQLGTLFRTGDAVLGYLYDFGDSWHHRITLEERRPADLSMRRPRCVGGENACPPEDVGGSHGYMDYLEAVLDPSHEAHAELVAWGGGRFDPSRFDVAEADARIADRFG